MAAKKSSSKQVTVTIDRDTLRKLTDALHVLADAAGALEVGASDTGVRGRAGGAKRGKKSAKK